MTKDARNFSEWFNIHLTHHAEAYAILRDKGEWPAGFIPTDIQFDYNWNSVLKEVIVDAFLEDIKHEH